ncbi:gamma-aminobutyric acid receptor subunit delta-like [Scylla paramamosain]|uniref:gamma-aminobutyric acid receptor subunit delta-like n=1 Tax=Scylla paramamosain TaxID=85552 RepID=UPI003083E664
MYYFDLVAMPMSFRGYGEYRVRKVENTWEWYNAVTNTTMATLSPLSLNYPVGRHKWNLQVPVCGQKGGQRMLTLSPCVPGEFTCDDGSCIAFSKRCDLKFDCIDKTDESFCDIVNFPGDYRSRLPPRPASDEALPIAVAVSMDTLNIDTTTMLLSVSYNLRMTWLDNRLTYNNLKPLTRLNTVSQEQVAQLWRPQLGFINTDDIQQTKVDEDAVTTVFRQHPVYTPNLADPYEVEIYRGDTNPLSTTRKYSTIYTCNFDLVLYPFDIQECYLRLQIISASSEYLVFNVNDSAVEYLGQKFLVEYGIGKINLKESDGGQYGEVQVQVELIRRYGFAMLNIYIPSVTLLTISYVTLYFRPTIFEVRVMTALTSQLVLATLFTQVSTSLPKTSYFKMVDIWLLFCILLIFFIIIFHTIIDLHLDYGDTSFTSGPPFQKISSGSTGVTRVSPINGKEGETKNYKEIFKHSFLSNTVKFYIILSKSTIFAVFLLFNAIYWGTLAKDSGLVYYY